MSRADERRKAIDLKAMDARDLIKAKFPAVLPQITTEQLDQVQRLIDIDSINADIDREWEELNRKSVIGRTAEGHAVRDPSKGAPDLVLKKKIKITETGITVRLDFEKLLIRTALKPTTDNPDEASYLLKVWTALAQSGVWLHVYRNNSQLARTQFTAANDHRKWFATLWFGSDKRNEFKTDSGQLTREALLSAPLLGVGYLQYVHNGPTMKLLRTAMHSVNSKLLLIMKLYNDWTFENDSLRGRILEWGSTKVVGEGMLGLKIQAPDKRVWEEPRQLMNRATWLLDAGKVMEANKFVILAAYQAEWGAIALTEYINYIKATQGSAGVILQALEAAERLGNIAEKLLLIRAMAGGLIRLAGRGAVNAAEEGATTIAKRQVPSAPTTGPTAAYEKVVKESETTIQSAAPRSARGTTHPGSDVPRSVRGGKSEGMWDKNQREQESWWDTTGHFKHKKDVKEYMDYVSRELQHLRKVNPNASMAEKNAIIERADKHWGEWLPGDGGGYPAKYWGEEINVAVKK